MIKYTYIIALVFFCFNLQAQKNYILPEPQSISFPESKQSGFRLSKKTSIEIKGVDPEKPFVKNLPNNTILFMMDVLIIFKFH